ncbi:hypothetical protein [Mesorhizobium sp. B2-3-5]|uniref:hypothetical protein n=1 Tax=Mesorhizobium sp. B2-3-5 TaxID=2589958 RepID=UPI0011282013|nr:hypothetical protein [Mesorhizobium sp. B2-3-5]TPM26961.1 hypothetical protein FJ958_19180 [Mesorhizobium sp. B2-3-5]
MTILPVSIPSDLGLGPEQSVHCRAKRAAERDTNDAGAIHILAINGGEVGTLRIVLLPEHAKFGGIAWLPKPRGKVSPR